MLFPDQPAARSPLQARRSFGRHRALLALLVGTVWLVAAPSVRAEAVRLTMPAFGSRAVVEVRGPGEEEAEEAARAALEEIAEIETLAAAPPGARDGTPVPVDPRWLEVLPRALDFCRWSDGANGPLGGRLYTLADAGDTTPAGRAAVIAAGRCNGLVVDAQAAVVTLAPGARLDLRHFAAGWAADRAVAVLRERGVTDGFVRVGPVQRGFGPGPDGRGWPVRLPVFPGHDTSLGDLTLRDAGLAIAGLAGERYVDQRTGLEREGVVAVLAISELGLDAQGLASSLYLLDTRQGMYRAGQLDPKPSVLWLLGSGEGLPLLVDFNWTAVESATP